MVKKKKISGILSRYKGVLTRIKKDPKLLFMILAADAGYILLVAILNWVFEPFQEAMLGSSINSKGLIFLSIMFMIGLFFVSVVAYSVMKYVLMTLVERFYLKVKFDFSRLGRFVFLNLRMFIAIMLFVVVLALLIAPLMPETGTPSLFIMIYAGVLLAVSLVMIYLFMNACHSAYFAVGCGDDIKKALRSLFFKDFKKYFYGLGMVFVSGLALILGFALIGGIFLIIFKQDLMSRFALIYNQVYTYWVLLIFYLGHTFNRIFFYGLFADSCKKKK